jgi:hypothetical protein
VCWVSSDQIAIWITFLDDALRRQSTEVKAADACAPAYEGVAELRLRYSPGGLGDEALISCGPSGNPTTCIRGDSPSAARQRWQYRA